MRLEFPLIAPVSMLENDEILERRIRFLWSAGIRLITFSALHPLCVETLKRLTLQFGNGLRFGLHDVLDIKAFKTLEAAGTPVDVMIMPHTNTAMIKFFSEQGITTMAGVYTLTELQRALGAGVQMVHLCPLQEMTPRILSTFSRFIPTSIPCFGSGDITENEIYPWLKAGLSGFMPDYLFDFTEGEDSLEQKEAISFITSLKLGLGALKEEQLSSKDSLRKKRLQHPVLYYNT